MTTSQMMLLGSSNSVSTATFDSSNKGANITLSNGSLRATRDNTGAWQTVWLTLGPHATGKYVFAFSIVTGTVDAGNFAKAGLGDTRITADQMVTGGTATCATVTGSSSGFENEYAGVPATGGTSSFTSGDVAMLAYDLDNGRAYLGKNGTWENNPTSASPTVGMTGYPALYAGLSIFAHSPNLVIDFLQSFPYAVPTGYSPWS